MNNRIEVERELRRTLRDDQPGVQEAPDLADRVSARITHTRRQRRMASAGLVAVTATLAITLGLTNSTSPTQRDTVFDPAVPSSEDADSAASELPLCESLRAGDAGYGPGGQAIAHPAAVLRNDGDPCRLSLRPNLISLIGPSGEQLVVANGGGERSLSMQRGGEVLVLVEWSNWCGPQLRADVQLSLDRSTTADVSQLPPRCVDPAKPTVLVLRSVSPTTSAGALATPGPGLKD